MAGTSYSTPVAIGIAANVLRFVEHVTREGLMNDKQRDYVFRRDGMKKILKAMSEERGDGYQFITPWRKMWDEDSTMDGVVSNMKQALKE